MNEENDGTPDVINIESIYDNFINKVYEIIQINNKNITNILCYLINSVNNIIDKV